MKRFAYMNDVVQAKSDQESREPDHKDAGESSKNVEDEAHEAGSNSEPKDDTGKVQNVPGV